MISQIQPWHELVAYRYQTHRYNLFSFINEHILQEEDKEKDKHFAVVVVVVEEKETKTKNNLETIQLIGISLLISWKGC